MELLELIRSLDRCPHGRHAGDDCAGWRGPGSFDRGCLGGRSLGNPYLHEPPPGRIGTTVHGQPITLKDISVAGEVWHWTHYVVKLGDGTILQGDKQPGTLEEAEKFARECGDPVARVMIQRVCPWVGAQSDLAVPLSPELREASGIPEVP
jgi:hypothetical protein